MMIRREIIWMIQMTLMTDFFILFVFVFTFYVILDYVQLHISI